MLVWTVELQDLGSVLLPLRHIHACGAEVCVDYMRLLRRWHQAGLSQGAGGGPTHSQRHALLAADITPRSLPRHAVVHTDNSRKRSPPCASYVWLLHRGRPADLFRVLCRGNEPGTILPDGRRGVGTNRARQSVRILDRRL
jgi:hypothetical protein